MKLKVSDVIIRSILMLIGLLPLMGVLFVWLTYALYKENYYTYHACNLDDGRQFLVAENPREDVKTNLDDEGWVVHFYTTSSDRKISFDVLETYTGSTDERGTGSAGNRLITQFGTRSADDQLFTQLVIDLEKLTVYKSNSGQTLGTCMEKGSAWSRGSLMEHYRYFFSN